MDLDLFRQTDGSETPLRGTDMGNLLEAMHKRYGVPGSQWKLSQIIIGDVRNFGAAIGAIDPETFSIETARFRIMRVLDLACGCEDYQKGENQMGIPRIFEPWLCRAMAMLGANVTGIDKDFPRSVIKTGKKGRHPRRVGLAESEWKFVQRDLTQPDAIDPDTFPDDVFDAVRCSRFIGNQAGPLKIRGQTIDMTRELGDAPLGDAPEMRRIWRENITAYFRVRDGIRQTAQRVLKEGGIYMLAPDNVEIKKNGELVKKEK